MNTLEQRYRWLLAVLPGSYRQQRGDEMLDTLLEGAAPDQQWPRVSEVTSVALLALRIRTGAIAPEAQPTPTGFALRMMALVGTFYFAVSGVVAASAWATKPLFRRDVLHTAPHDHGYWSLVLYTLAVPALWVAAFLILVLGARRTGRAVATLAFLGTITTVLRQRDLKETAVFATLTILAIWASFIRSTPPVTGRRWWIGSLAVIGAMAWLIFATGSDTNSATMLEAGLVAAALAAGVYVHKSPAWPLGLSVLGVPLLFNFHMDTRTWFYMYQDNFQFRPGLAIEALFIAAAIFSSARALVPAWWANRQLAAPSEAEPAYPSHD